MFQTHDNFAYLEIMAIKLSQSHGETTYYKSLRSSYLKVMAKQFTTNHGDQVISMSWRSNLLQIMAIKLSQSHGETTYYKSWRYKTKTIVYFMHYLIYRVQYIAHDNSTSVSFYACF